MNKLSPFKWFCLQNFPFIEADFDALTNYELMCKVVEYLNATIKKTNELGNQVEVLTNWFNNLDVQDEINNKLDEMAESGELEEIIAEYLTTSAIIGFGTKAEMKAGTNFIDGSIARTLGNTTATTGDGSFYKIRTITSGDVVDEDNKVALTNFPSLIAVKIPDKRANDLQAEIDNFDTHEYRNAIYIGNSYCIGIGSSDDNTGLFALTKDKLYDNAYLKYGSGTGFTAYNSEHTTTFRTLLQQAIDDTSIDNDTITDINFVCAWGEARGISLLDDYPAQVLSEMNQIMALVNANFPNIKRVNVVNSETRPELNYDESYYYQLYDVHRDLQILCARAGMIYCGWIGFENLLNSDLFAADRGHPNDAGYQRLAGYFVEAILGTFENQTKRKIGYVPMENITGMRAVVESIVSPTISSVKVMRIDNSEIPASPTYTANTFASMMTNLSPAIPPIRTTTTDTTDNTKKVNSQDSYFKFYYGNIGDKSVLPYLGAFKYYTTIGGNDFGIKWSIPTSQLPGSKPTMTGSSIMMPNDLHTQF